MPSKHAMRILRGRAREFPVELEHRGYIIEARREESLGGDSNIYYCILRKGYLVVDNFTSDETLVPEYVETVLKPMVDDIIENPLHYYDSEEDYLEVSHGDEQSEHDC